MNVSIEGLHELASQTPTEIVDCDVHPTFRSTAEVKHYLPTQWHEHIDQFGLRQRQPFATDHAYPRVAASCTARRVSARRRPSWIGFAVLAEAAFG